MVLQEPQKLGLLLRFTQNSPLFVWHLLGAEGSHCTVHCPAALRTPSSAGAGSWEHIIMLTQGDYIWDVLCAAAWWQ